MLKLKVCLKSAPFPLPLRRQVLAGVLTEIWYKCLLLEPLGRGDSFSTVSDLLVKKKKKKANFPVLFYLEYIFSWGAPPQASAVLCQHGKASPLPSRRQLNGAVLCSFEGNISMELGQENPSRESGASPRPKPGVGGVRWWWAGPCRVATFSWCQHATFKTQLVAVACLVPSSVGFSWSLPEE